MSRSTAAPLGIVLALMLLAIPLLSALLAYAVLTPTAWAQDPDNSVCPLSDDQTRKSIQAFAKIANVFTKEPRCVNCHGAVNPFGADADRTHGGGQISPIMKTEPGAGENFTDLTTQDIGATLGLCRECHGAFSGVWALAPPSNLFVGKDAFTLCKLMRDQFGDASSFINHIEHDASPDSPFIQEAFTGRMGLTDFGRRFREVERRFGGAYPAPPIGVTHQDLIRMAHDWVDAQGGMFQGGIECGCKFLGWIGRIDWWIPTPYGRHWGRLDLKFAMTARAISRARWLGTTTQRRSGRHVG